MSCQQVKSFYSGPLASYSTEYNLANTQYVPSARSPQPVSAYAYRPARFQPLVAVPASTPAVAAVPAFQAPVSRTRYYPDQTSSVRATSSGSFRPAVANVAVPAYPVSAGVRVVGGSNGRFQERDVYPPTPYAFEYSVNSAEGGHSRTERGDGAGRVTGSYTIQLADGRSRVVEYVADEGGYRANVRTNEFGTESQSPADVTFQSSALPAKEAVLLGERDPNFRRFGPAHHNRA